MNTNKLNSLTKLQPLEGALSAQLLLLYESRDQICCVRWISSARRVIIYSLDPDFIVVGFFIQDFKIKSLMTSISFLTIISANLHQIIFFYGVDERLFGDENSANVLNPPRSILHVSHDVTRRPHQHFYPSQKQYYMCKCQMVFHRGSMSWFLLGVELQAE